MTPAVAREARRAASPPLLATLLLRLGWTDCLLGRYRFAERTLRQAIAVSARAHGPTSVPLAQALNLRRANGTRRWPRRLTNRPSSSNGVLSANDSDEV
jgi:hypothetical protein